MDEGKTFACYECGEIYSEAVKFVCPKCDEWLCPNCIERHKTTYDTNEEEEEDEIE